VLLFHVVALMVLLSIHMDSPLLALTAQLDMHVQTTIHHQFLVLTVGMQLVLETHSVINVLQAQHAQILTEYPLIVLPVSTQWLDGLNVLNVLQDIYEQLHHHYLLLLLKVNILLKDQLVLHFVQQVLLVLPVAYAKLVHLDILQMVETVLDVYLVLLVIPVPQILQF
jgi:hypothetical protein